MSLRQFGLSLLVLVAALTVYLGVRSMTNEPAPQAAPAKPPEGSALATFGGGCFWCTEAVFLELKGVRSVVSGYSGGHVPNPTYRQICTGTTGHAEAIQIAFDPTVIAYEELLDVFWKTHDPTTLNQQGPDVGPQYRSVVFAHSDAQKIAAEKVKRDLDASGEFAGPIVTEIVPIDVFYRAEQYHQNYFALNPSQPYCRAIVRSKVDKVRHAFPEKLKSSDRP